MLMCICKDKSAVHCHTFSIYTTVNMEELRNGGFMICVCPFRGQVLLDEAMKEVYMNVCLEMARLRATGPFTI